MGMSDLDMAEERHFEAFTSRGFQIECHGEIGSVDYDERRHVGVVTLSDATEQDAEVTQDKYGYGYKWTCQTCGKQCEVEEA